MKNLKKTTAVLTVAALMTMSMGMSAYAVPDYIDSIGGISKSEVTGTYKSGTSASTVYKVEVEWGDMQFTYTAGNEDTWNPDTHSYGGGTEGRWTNNNAGGNEITVTNHSNAKITAKVDFQAETSFDKVSATYSDNNFELASAAEGASLNDPTQAPNKTVSVSLHGDPGSLASDSQKIGSLTVTITE